MIRLFPYIARALQLLAILALVPAADALAQSVGRDETRRVIRMTYGTVDTIAQARLESQAASGAVLGGVIGAAATHNRHDRVRNAAAGALIGALFTRAAEGSHRVDEITIRMADGSRIKVVQDHLDGIAVGGCVSIEEGAHTNVRAVSADLCGGADVHADVAVAAQRQSEAGACDLAKEQLAQAQNEQEFEFASRKIRVLCH